jgi:hypothetical protein
MAAAACRLRQAPSGGQAVKHGRADYAGIQDRDGVIGADEPVFILRAQDELAAALVVEWAERYLQRGGGIELHRQAMEVAVEMRSWARKNGTKLPGTEQPR